jgi:hypothetical protein
VDLDVIHQEDIKLIYIYNLILFFLELVVLDVTLLDGIETVRVSTVDSLELDATENLSSFAIATSLVLLGAGNEFGLGTFIGLNGKSTGVDEVSGISFTLVIEERKLEISALGAFILISPLDGLAPTPGTLAELLALPINDIILPIISPPPLPPPIILMSDSAILPLFD